MEDNGPDTPKMCEVCAGEWTDCKWCDHGRMDIESLKRWREFRTKIRKVSGTYSLFRDMVEALADKLETIGTIEGLILSVSGREALYKWTEAETDSVERENASADIAAFHRKAVEMLANTK